jgi:hypothetical protein
MKLTKNITKLSLLFIMVFSLTSVVMAQTAAPTPDPEDEEVVGEVRVQVESVFIRALPDRESTIMSSAFLDDKLIVIGRNVDGSWFLVQRPNRNYNLGWLEHIWLDWDFEPEFLPLADTETGVTGDTEVIDTGFSVFIVEGVTMRDGPGHRNQRIMVIPHSSTVPIIERNQDGSWFRVNYLGTVGWIAEFTTRTPENFMQIPEADNLPPIIPRLIIPPEVQLEEVRQLRVYVSDSHYVAAELAVLWQNVINGEVMPCTPPGFVTDYLYTEYNVQRLPELDRMVPRLDDAVVLLNASIEILNQCGVIFIDDIRDARADAINARMIFDSTLNKLDDVEDVILRR